MGCLKIKMHFQYDLHKNFVKNGKILNYLDLNIFLHLA